jgi:hypothetical protein
MQIRHQRSRSPEDMFISGILQQGARGLDLRPAADLGENIGDLHQYGVDWSVHNDRQLMRHLYTHNPSDQAAAESFSLPEHMARVECEPPGCPFTPREMDILRVQMARRVPDQVRRRDMTSRRVVWCHAYSVAREIGLNR